ncbi:MAG TPA: hypothetical protein VMV72_11035 [Verrucomicrobiae bacterium]|nr:hypothetical protein [Verrucomicrobiae bacterium]
MKRLAKWAKKYGALTTVIAAIIASVTAVGLKLVPWVWENFVQSRAHEHLTVTVRHVALDTGAAELEFENQGNRDATVYSADITIKPPPDAKLNDTYTVLSNGIAPPGPGPVFMLPPRSCYEVTVTDAFFKIMLSQEPGMVIPVGTKVHTNLIPSPESLKGVCRNFSDGTPLNFGIGFRVVDTQQRRHWVDCMVGTYARHGDSPTMDYTRGVPRSFQLLPSPVDQASRIIEGSMQVGPSNWTKIGP